jgi:hypothetical protein
MSQDDSSARVVRLVTSHWPLSEITEWNLATTGARLLTLFHYELIMFTDTLMIRKQIGDVFS